MPDRKPIDLGDDPDGDMDGYDGGFTPLPGSVPVVPGDPAAEAAEAAEAVARWLAETYDLGESHWKDHWGEAHGALAAALPHLREQADSATCAELRRQLSGTNALLADAVRERDTLRAQRQAVLDLCDDEAAKIGNDHESVFIADVWAALGVTGDDERQQ